MNYSSTEDIPEDAYGLKIWRFDSVKLKEVRFYKPSVRKHQLIFSFARRLVLTCLLCFLLSFSVDSSLDFGFPTNFTASSSKQLSQVFYLLVFGSLIDG